MQSSKEYHGEIRKHSSAINAKKKRKTIEWERLEIPSRKLEIAQVLNKVLSLLVSPSSNVLAPNDRVKAI